MLQRNEKGMQARLYFIESEKKLKQVQTLVTQSTQQDIVSLKQEVSTLRQDVMTLNRNMNIMVDNFNKASTYFKEMQEEIDELKTNHQQNTGDLENTTQRVDETTQRVDETIQRVLKIEDILDFTTLACRSRLDILTRFGAKQPRTPLQNSLKALPTVRCRQGLFE
jgi:ABC-type transporter Mla subunit MlaD